MATEMLEQNDECPTTDRVIIFLSPRYFSTDNQKIMKTLVLVAAFSATVSMAAYAADPSDAQVQAAFKKADLDNDGTVSWLEARKFGITRPAFTHSNPDKDASLDKIEFKAAIKWQFEHADPDKDGTLDSKEAAKVGVKGKAAFKAADPDKDNTLDLAEYFEVLTRQAK